MPIRPTPKAPKFGAWLQLQRGGRSLEQIAHKVRPHVAGLGLKVNRSVIQKFEKGRVPSWPMLAAFSRAFDVPIEETVQRLVAALEIPGAGDLIRHASTAQPSAPHPAGAGGGVVGGAAQTGVRESEITFLREQIEAYEAVLANVRILAGDLVAAIGPQGGTPAGTEARSRRRRGKNH